MKASLIERLKGLNPTIAEICRVSGTAGVSLGVLHEGKIIYTQHFGHRDIKRQLRPDNDTIYDLASLSKAFTAASIGVLVAEKTLEWDTVVSTALPEFIHRDKAIRERATVLDFLSHRTGLAPKGALWSPERGHLGIRDSQIIKTCTYLESIAHLRTKWIYNNWGYALADDVLEKLTRQEWGEFLKENFFKPLGMHRTVTACDPAVDNVAEGYMALADGTPYHIPRPRIEDGNAMEGAAGVQSTITDLLKFYGAFMHALADQEETHMDFTKDSPFKQVQTLVKAQIPLCPSCPENERSYALGWVRTELPGPLGDVGMNKMYVEQMPTVGKGIQQPLLVLHHQGSLPAFLNSVHLLPESRSAIIVLTNCMARNDAADWLGQLLLEAFIDNPIKNDYLWLAKYSAEVSISLWPKMEKELKERQTPGTPVKPMDEYVGVYWNWPRTWRIEVFRHDEDLCMCFQGNRKQAYVLAHYQYDEFSWLLTHDEDVHRARFPSTFADFYILRFRTKFGVVDSVNWRHDPLVHGGETFSKDP